MQITVTPPEIFQTRRARILGIIATAGAVALLTMGFSCGSSGNPSGLATENSTAQDQLTIDQQIQPAPLFTQKSVMRAAITEIEAIQVLGEKTTSFFFNQGVRNPIFECPSFGEPIASTAQLTNPVQPENVPDDRQSTATGLNTIPVGNIDPNGTYPPSNSTGTYVLCLAPNGHPYAHYWEGFVDTYSINATWDSKLGQVVISGQPAMPVCQIGRVQVTRTKTKTATVCTK